MHSTNYQQGIIPGCTISVFLSGTQTPATIYSDGNKTPLSNPFTANGPSSPNAGAWIFWAAAPVTYDVVASGGIPPNTYPSPVTLLSSIEVNVLGFGTLVTTPPIQTDINSVASGGSAPVVIPQTYSGTDRYTNPTQVPVFNYRKPPNISYTAPVSLNATFDVKGDGQEGLCAGIASNPQTTCSGMTTPYTQADVGKLFLWYGAGPQISNWVVTTVPMTVVSGGVGGSDGLNPIKFVNGPCTAPPLAWVQVTGGVPTGTVTIWDGGNCTAPPTLGFVTTTKSGTMTSYSVTGSTITVQATNSLTVGQYVELLGCPTNSPAGKNAGFMNFQYGPVLSTGLSGSQFEFNLNASTWTGYADTVACYFTVATTFTGGSIDFIDLPTTIVSVQNGTTVTLADAPFHSGSFSAVWGSDDQVGLNAACNAKTGVAGVNSLAYGHYFHSGVSLISQGIKCHSPSNWIEGAGWSGIASLGGSTIIYAGKTTGDSIWENGGGWGAKLTDMGLRGNSWAKPDGLKLSRGHFLDDNGNGAMGQYDKLWIGWMWGDGVGIGTGGYQLTAGIYADAVNVGNDDFNQFYNIHITDSAHGIDGNNDQATQWKFLGNLEMEYNGTAYCWFGGATIQSLYTEHNRIDLYLGPCDNTTAYPINLIINDFEGESSSQAIVWNPNYSVPEGLTINLLGDITPPQYLNPDGIGIDLQGMTGAELTINGGSSGKVRMGPYGYIQGFPQDLVLNGFSTNISNFITPWFNDPINNNIEAKPFVFTYNADASISRIVKKVYAIQDNADFNKVPIPAEWNDFEGLLRNFGVAEVHSPHPPGQTDAPANLAVIYGLSAGPVGATGSTTYRYELTCSDQMGNETTVANANRVGSAFSPFILTFSNGNATLNTTNYNEISFWQHRGCLYYNAYGDEGSGAIGFLTSFTVEQTIGAGGGGNQWNDQGQYTKNTGRVPPTSSQSGTIYAENGYRVGPDTNPHPLGLADVGAPGYYSAPTYCTTPGTLDQTCINNAMAAMPANGGVLELGPGIYNIASTINITKPVTMTGQGIGYVPLPGVDLNTAWTPVTELLWTGGSSGTVIDVNYGTNASVSAVNLSNFAINANNVGSLNCATVDTMQWSTWSNMLLTNCPNVGLQMVSSSSVANYTETLFNRFYNLNIRNVGVGISMNYGNLSVGSDINQNSFYSTQIAFKTYGIELVCEDNNTFVDTALYQQSGSGYGVYIHANNTGGGATCVAAPQSNYFFHLQASTGGFYTDTNSQTVIGYDKANAEPSPVFSGTGGGYFSGIFMTGSSFGGGLSGAGMVCVGPKGGVVGFSSDNTIAHCVFP